MWKIHVLPRIHIFLWLLANNKVLTRGNLAKKRQVEDKICLFYTETESLTHLFFLLLCGSISSIKVFIVLTYK
jgi:hypothetical protein